MLDFLNENLVRQENRIYDESFDAERIPLRLNPSDCVEISLVLEGKGIHKVLNDVVECREGDLYILDSGIPHGYCAKSGEQPLTVCSLVFRPSLVVPGEWADPQSSRFCFGVFTDMVPISCAMLNHKTQQEVRSIFARIEEEVKNRDHEWESAVRAHICLLLVLVARYINMADTIHVRHPKEWTVVSAAMRAVVDRCSDSNMTLESIASALFVSAPQLSRMFQRVTGESFADYVRSVRISMACMLLRTTSLTNEDIVGCCGLKDIPSFYRLFKAQMGMTPYKYRMSQQTYKGETVMSIYLEISEQLQKGKWKIVQELVQKAVDEGLPAAQILNEGLLAGMSVIGERFKNNVIYVPDVLVAARAMNMGLRVLKPLLVEDGVQSTGRVCIGTVQGDLHDIGKNLVRLMMEGKGLEVIDLGTDVSPETFVRTAIEQKCQVICCSALLTTTMEVMGEVVQAAEAAGIRDTVKIMVGGAPVTEEFCRQIGADKYTSDAASAADAAVELCGC